MPRLERLKMERNGVRDVAVLMGIAKKAPCLKVLEFCCKLPHPQNAGEEKNGGGCGYG